MSVVGFFVIGQILFSGFPRKIILCDWYFKFSKVRLSETFLIGVGLKTLFLDSRLRYTFSACLHSVSLQYFCRKKLGVNFCLQFKQRILVFDFSFWKEKLSIENSFSCVTFLHLQNYGLYSCIVKSFSRKRSY